MNKIKSESNFNTEISDGLTLVDFYADWCGPCKMMEPKLEQFNDQNEDVKIIKVNIEELTKIVKKYNVRSIPTLVLISEGEEVERFVGTTSVKDIKEMISDYKS